MKKGANKRNRICMIIPSFSARGGIATVVSGYKGSLLEQEYEIRYIETYVDGGKTAKLRLFTGELIEILNVILKQMNSQQLADFMIK